MRPTATPPAAIFAFFDMSVASFAATAALCSENGPALPAVPDRDPETSLRHDPEEPLRADTCVAIRTSGEVAQLTA
ncbi:hypothetical protein GCM10010121_094460 [Streptomyces brasiliensis]|uniref:Uncharacterized protein n=1 Tax=Streptomyces brasiliensis TaxID=1954 RepID=A0A917PAP5_9ACTN|nr:hypothetical protein GCM10010121_094460 [Streptomyces brasiliensis]